MGIYFIFVGVNHFILPPGLPASMGWMYELPPGLHLLSGSAEILGGLGLILPSITRIKPNLTPLAGAGLILTMLGAALWHLSRGEPANIVQNLVLAALLAFISYGRWKLQPIGERAKTSES
jgi:uncharacterized membrane protein